MPTFIKELAEQNLLLSVITMIGLMCYFAWSIIQKRAEIRKENKAERERQDYLQKKEAYLRQLFTDIEASRKELLEGLNRLENATVKTQEEIEKSPAFGALINSAKAEIEIAEKINKKDENGSEKNTQK